ncbi:Kinesin-like protein KIF13A [Taenia solium]|eukprot:TsM_000382800 transcript=TsM_000382800 gene=TsM_000382800
MHTNALCVLIFRWALNSIQLDSSTRLSSLRGRGSNLGSKNSCRYFHRRFQCGSFKFGLLIHTLLCVWITTMNRRTLPTPPLGVSSSNSTAEDNPTNDFSLTPTPKSIIRMRCRPVARANPNEPLRSHHLRRSPFASRSGGSSVQRILDNQRGVPSTGARGLNVPSSPLYAPSTFNSPRLNDSVGNFEEIREKLVEANLLAERANTLLKERRSNVRYHVSLQVPIHCLNQAKREHRQLQCEPVIELHRGGVRERSLSLARMQYNLRELEANQGENEDSGVSLSGSSNVTNEMRRVPTRQQESYAKNGDLVLIGVANLYLRCLLFISEFAYQSPILSPQGEVSGRVNVELSTAILSEDSRSRKPSKSTGVPDLLDRELCDLGGNVLEVRVAIHEAVGIPHSFAKMILCHYQMLGVEEPIVVLPKRESFSVQAPPDPTTREYERTERCVFDHRRVFHLPLNRQVLNSLADYALAVEVYGSLQEPKSSTLIRRITTIRGPLHLNTSRQVADQHHQRANSPPQIRTMKLRRYKSDLADKRKPSLQGSHTLAVGASPANGLSNEVATRLAEDWLRVQRRVDFWVAIEELMEDGSFKKVPVIPSSDVKTGGIYQLRQGLNRRIRVLIRPNELSRRERGVLPLFCETVSKVSVGCVTRSLADFENGLNNYPKSHTAPDSYQEYDLETVRHKWCNAMDEWQSYLQSNLQALAKKREKEAVDEAKEGYLLNRWVSSILERDAILVPAPGSSLPGAPATETPPPGLEQHTPLVFADIGDGTFDKALKVGAHSYLEGEEAALKEGKAFVTLPLIKTYATLIGALASWDSNLHESDLLNKITPPSERIYLIVKVHIHVSKPTLMTLVLRKRICVRICRRNALSNLFKSSFSRMVSNEKEEMLWTGVAYQFVAGIPQMAPYTLNSSMVEVEKEETTSAESLAGQYMRTIQSVSSELYLDGLRQEVALREALATNQQKHQPFDLANLGLATHESDVSESSLSRSRSFTDKPKRIIWSDALRQRSQTRQKPSLYFNLSKIHNETENSPTSPLFFQDRGERGRRTSSTDSDETAVQQLVEDLRTSTVSRMNGPSASEEQMAWSRRDREKQRGAD